MRPVEDYDPSLRNDAVKSFSLILNFLQSIEGKPSAFTDAIPDFKTLDLEKQIPDENHKNLLLVFSPGLTGAKFSYREDRKFVITIFVDGVFNWDREIVKNISEWFIKRRSSFVHEFVHYLDIKEIKDLDTFTGVDRKNLVSYSNNPIELRGHLQQVLHDFELDLEYKTSNNYKKFKQLEKTTRDGKTKEGFIKNIKSVYFPSDFLAHLSKENEQKINKALSNKYYEINTTNEWLNAVTEDIVLETIKILLESVRIGSAK